MSEISTETIGPAPRLAADHAGAGPLVVFLHGVGGDRTNWRAQLAAFADRFHCVAPDTRGYHRSEAYEGPVTIGDLAGDVDRVRAHFGAERVIVVGLSMGGMVAQEYYHRHPDRVAALVLCDTFSGFEQPGIVEQMKAQRRQPFEEGKTMADVAAQSARMLSGPNAGPDVIEALTRSAAALDKDVYLATADALLDFRRTADLPKISVPTLVLTGEHDKPAAPERARAMADRIPGAAFEVIADAGHVSNLEQPERFNAVVGAFLDRQRARLKTAASA